MDFSGKDGKMSKKVKNNEKVSYIAENGHNWWTIRKIIFFGFFLGKYGKMSKKVNNDEKGSYIAENGQNWSNIKKIIFSTLFRKRWKNVEKSEKWWKRVTNCCKRPKLMKK